MQFSAINRVCLTQTYTRKMAEALVGISGSGNEADTQGLTVRSPRVFCKGTVQGTWVGEGLFVRKCVGCAVAVRDFEGGGTDDWMMIKLMMLNLVEVLRLLTGRITKGIVMSPCHGVIWPFGRPNKWFRVQALVLHFNIILWADLVRCAAARFNCIWGR